MKPSHCLYVFSIVASFSVPLWGQSTWNGNADSEWSNTANWSPGVPAEGTDIIISDSTGHGIRLDDGDHLLGNILIGSTGTRTSGFTIDTTQDHFLSITGGLISNGNFTGGIGPRLRGNTILTQEQTWQIGGDPGGAAPDRGVAFNEIAGSGIQGSLQLDGTLNKLGTGQLTLGAITAKGAGDINVLAGSLKLNAGGSLPLTVEGPGKIIVDNTAQLIISQNSGSFEVSRPVQFKLAAGLETGSGTNNKSGTYAIASDMEWTGVHTIINSRDNNNANHVNFDFTGVMSGAGSITKSGPSQLIFSGTNSNTHSGNITITEGELRFDKTGGKATLGNVFITGGSLRLAQDDQLVDDAEITVTGGAIAFTGNRTQSLASLNIDSTDISSVSGFTVTGTTTLNSGRHQLNSGHSFVTESLSINNSTLQMVGNATAPDSNDVHVGEGGLSLENGRIEFGDGNSGGGNDSASQLHLLGDVHSSGNSQFFAHNRNGERVVDLGGGSREFIVEDGSLSLEKITFANGTVVKSGEGTLVLSQPGSTADFSLTEGGMKIEGTIDVANLSLSGGSLLMDLSGDAPARLIASGDFESSDGSIEISAEDSFIPVGALELVRYEGALTGTPAINIPELISKSRLSPSVDYGTGSDSAITLNTAASPIDLVWDGSNSGGVWDNSETVNFNNGGEKFYPLDSMRFDDTGASSQIQLDDIVFPTEVVFDHGNTLNSYILNGDGEISGSTALIKDGSGTTIIATDNSYTGATHILGGALQIGDGGTLGTVGSGDIHIETDATLRFVKDGSTILNNAISGGGTIEHQGPGTTIFTNNNNQFSGLVEVTGGALQIGDGGGSGALNHAPVRVDAGASFIINHNNQIEVASEVSGEGSLVIDGGSINITGFNTHSGGITATNGGVIRTPADWTLGAYLDDVVEDAIYLDHGGLKNLDSYTNTDSYRGVYINGEAYFTAGWNKALEIGGPITGTGDIFINYDSGTVMFESVDSDWEGVLTLGAEMPGASGTTGGRLEIKEITDGGVPGPLGASSADPDNIVFQRGRLIYNGDDATSNRGFTLDEAGYLEITWATLGLSGEIAGSGTLYKHGSGNLILSGDSSFSGNVEVNNGGFLVTHENALGQNLEVLTIAGDASQGNIPEFQISGDISLAVDQLRTSGAGLENLAGALRNISGHNTINVAQEVILQVGNGNSTFYSDAGTMTINTPRLYANTGNRQLFLDGPGDGMINGSIENGNTANLPVTKNGSGSWTLNGAHSYSGATIVNEGTLSLSQRALDDEAEVRIAAGATLNLDFSGVDQVGALVLDGVAKPDGIYDANTDPGFITGNGSIRVGADASGEPEGYEGWLAGYPFAAGSNDGALDDPDGDGIPNLLEYVFGGVPVGANAADQSILPTHELTSEALILSFRRSVESLSDVTLKVQWSTDLINWTDFVTVGANGDLPVVSITQGVPSAELDTIVVTIPRSVAGGGLLFARVQASK